MLRTQYRCAAATTSPLTRARSNARFNARFATAQQEFEPTYNAAPSQLLPIIATYAPNDIVLARSGSFPKAGITRKPDRRTTLASRPLACPLRPNGIGNRGPDGLSCAAIHRRFGDAGT